MTGYVFVSAEANKYFVEYISKAYQALTDPVSRENYEKYGHPDGRQVWVLILLKNLLSVVVLLFLVFACACLSQREI